MMAWVHGAAWGLRRRVGRVHLKGVPGGLRSGIVGPKAAPPGRIVMVLAMGAIGLAMAQPSIGLSIGINRPGVYGQINIDACRRPPCWSLP